MFLWEFSDWCFKPVSFVLLYCTNYGMLVAIKNFGRESQVLQPNSKDSQRKFKYNIIFISYVSYNGHTLILKLAGFWDGFFRRNEVCLIKFSFK